MAFSLDPAVIDECVGICDDMIDKLEDGHRSAVRLGRVYGFGDLDSGRQLTVGYEQKGQLTASAIADLRRAVERTRQALLDVKDGAIETDTDFAAILAANVQEIV
ncbi:hypothetical protein [Rhodococcus sp. HNM0569]|uniref:hypothetical protein n=1 Tax=Rhodococcus sp. HNM0569 TaxID=2716340 RepID=UPI00146F5AF5|nr:hypothetical protein [Rhodococcus sp. HNM0569]NLU84611.1 hypothetical protein [Rhodococcus sp. HNM0569]